MAQGAFLAGGGGSVQHLWRIQRERPFKRVALALPAVRPGLPPRRLHQYIPPVLYVKPRPQRARIGLPRGGIKHPVLAPALGYGGHRCVNQPMFGLELG